MTYYMNDGYCMRPRRHWCFLGEIDESSSFIRMTAFVHTKFGENNIRVAFHPDDDTYICRGFRLDTTITKNNTLCILYGGRKTFMDMSEGIRSERLECVYVFKAPLSNVLAEADHLLTDADAIHAKACRHCFNCGEPESETRQL